MVEVKMKKIKKIMHRGQMVSSCICDDHLCAVWCGLPALTTAVEDQQAFVLHPFLMCSQWDMAVEGRGEVWLGTVCVCVRMVFVGRNVSGWESSISNHKMPSSKLCAHASPFP